MCIDSIINTIKISPNLSLDLVKARKEDIPKISHVMKSCAIWLEKEGYTHWECYKNDPGCLDDIVRGKVYCAFSKSKELIATFTIADTSPSYANGTFEAHWEDSKGTAKFFKKLAVLPTYHGNGIGKSLLREAEKISKSFGVKYLRLDINPRIPWLGEYYTKLGFELKANLPAGITFEKKL